MGGQFQGTLAVMAEQCTGRGVRGVVGAAAPLAAALGAEAMRAGGNAFDGAVTAALAETVLLPPKCGLAGDLVALCLTPDRDEPEALVSIGGAPQGLQAAIASHGLTPTGPVSVGVPAAPAGYAALIDRGRRGRAAAAAPAISIAQDGFVWAPICRTLAEESHDLVLRWHPEGTAYFPHRQPLPAGSVVRLPGLAETLSEWVDRGSELFGGPVGEATVATVAERGGILTMEDLERFGRARWEEPARGRVTGHHIWATPAPTHGPSLIDAVHAAVAGDDAGRVWGRVQQAIAVRRGALGDPNAGTSMVTAADAEGNAVAIIHSNSYPRFGSGLVVERYDLILANRAGRGFTPNPGHPNHPAAGRRPATTLHVWGWGDTDGRATMLGATPGGANQMPWNAQLLQQLVDGEPVLGMLVAAPRWEWLPDSNGVRIERGMSERDTAALQSIGAPVESVDRWGLRSAQQVVARPIPGQPIVAAVDPRTGGAAVPV